MSESKPSILLVAESDEFEATTVEAVPPTWRDVWAILRGRYEPRVRRVKRLTLRGTDRLMKQAYGEPLRRALNRQPPFLERLRDDASRD